MFTQPVALAKMNSDDVYTYTVFINLMYCSPNTVELSVAESSGDTSQEEPVVLGVERCRKEMRSPRYATEPCILCQEQQEVRETRPCDMKLTICFSSKVLAAEYVC